MAPLFRQNMGALGIHRPDRLNWFEIHSAGLLETSPAGLFATRKSQLRPEAALPFATVEMHSGCTVSIELRVACKADDVAIFNPSSGQTCQGWGAAFVNTYGGYIDNPQDNTASRYCQYPVGDQFYEPLDISIRVHNRFRDA
ncbi:uncharacterized protein B0H18DRAFT_959640 [Fomitopsis serialis]|uniref:uncharacterized protein n=1 Tax=Fomitopsis serialis TaxID=139415 RepID=UPI0020073636|nr:uncharacterized protein B0H18DRAFT_959640 [Neoantrodia serialis]KAH9914726.1 hypothetical protein B0H18DRAFT_959640 [Neoantrodia serialis]